MSGNTIRKGGSFLVEEASPGEIFTPEDFREEHKMIVDTVEDFIQNEVQPHLAEIEHKDFGLTRRLMRQAGELGLLGADIAEEYGGAGLDSIACLLIDEHLASAGSFGRWFSSATRPRKKSISLLWPAARGLAPTPSPSPRRVPMPCQSKPRQSCPRMVNTTR